MKIKLYDNLLKRLLPAVSLLWAMSCTDEVNNPSSTTDLGDEPVMVRATTMDTGVATRAGDTGPFVGENTTIRNKTMLFTYPSQPEGYMKSAYCVFDNEGIGYVYADMNKSGEPLRWKDIRTGAASYPDYYPDDKNDTKAEDAVFLDNLVNYPVENKTWAVPDNPGNNFEIDFFNRILTCKEQKDASELNPDHEFGQDPSTAFVPIENDQFKFRFRQMIAPMENKEAEEVDIIWGKITKPTPNKSLHFELEHQMTAISFRFYSEDQELASQLESSVEAVWLDKVPICLEDNSTNSQYHNILYAAFSRKRGSVYGRSDLYREVNTANGLYLVDAMAKDGRPTELEPPIMNGQTTYYATPAWIVPPFKWAGKPASARPKLSFRLENGDVYSGVLPERINHWEYNSGTRKWTLIENDWLYFRKGHHISFKVRVNKTDGQREILFEEITVEPFVWRMNESPNLAQNGIYSGEHLETLAQTHSADPSGDNHKLMRYGSFDKERGVWIFFVRGKIEIPTGAELPKFKHENFEIQASSEDFGIFQGGKEVEKDQLLDKSPTE